MPSRFQRLREFLGFSPHDSFDDIPSELVSDYNAVSTNYDVDGSAIFEADAISSRDITDPARVVAEFDFPDLNLSDNIDYGAFSRFTELSSDRASQYAAYDSMTSDAIISSALEMYADDASQYDNQGRLIWAESNSADLVDYIDKLLDVLNIDKMLWAIYYNLALYGDVYLRLFKKTSDIYDKDNYPYVNIYDQLELQENILDIKSQYLPYVELVDDPENVYELVKNGKTAQYAYINQDETSQSNQLELFPPDQFVHIYIENPHIRDRETFSFKAKEAGTDLVKTYTYKVRRGKSMLHDVFTVEKEIQLLENALLLNRISKSVITRLVQIEVGDMPKPEVRTLTRRLKTKLEAKLSIDAQQKDMKNYLSSSGIDNLIVSPTRNGKGGISVETITADPDTKNLADLDYFTDKRFGGLRIPKAFMGYDETLSANSGGTLTQLDNRYGRSIKRLQTCVVKGITDMVNLFLLHDNRLNDIGEFKIRVVSPTTADDLARDETLSNKLNMVSNIVTMFEDDPQIDKVALFQHLITNFVGDSRLSDEIYCQRVEFYKKQQAEQEATEGEGEEGGEQEFSEFEDSSDLEGELENPEEEEEPEEPEETEESEESSSSGSRRSTPARQQSNTSRQRPGGNRQRTSPAQRPGGGAVGSSEIRRFMR